MVNCHTCHLPAAPEGFQFPEDRRELRKLGQFCKCIKVSTLRTCARLSIANARRYLEDAEILLKNERISGMLTSALLCVEECGKARFAMLYLKRGQDVKYSDYAQFFLDHEKKIVEGLSINRRINFVVVMTSGHQETKEDSMYVSYNFNLQEWFGPWSTDVASLPEYDMLRRGIGSKKFDGLMINMREAQKIIGLTYYPTLLSEIRMAVEILENEFVDFRRSIEGGE